MQPVARGGPVLGQLRQIAAVMPQLQPRPRWRRPRHPRHPLEELQQHGRIQGVGLVAPLQRLGKVVRGLGVDHHDLGAKLGGDQGDIERVDAGGFDQHPQRALGTQVCGEEGTQRRRRVVDLAAQVLGCVFKGEGMLAGTDIQCEQGRDSR